VTGRRPSSQSLVERALVKDCVQDRLLRIVHSDGIRTWLFDVNASDWPFVVETKQLFADYDRDPPNYEVIFDEPWQLNLTGFQPGSRSGERHEEHWRIIEFLLEGTDLGPLMLKGTRRLRIDAAVEKMKTTRQTVVSIVKRYMQRGMTFEALRPDFDNCGGPGKAREIPAGVKTGRPRTVSKGKGISTSKAVRRQLQVGADYYLSCKQPTYGEAWDYLIGKFYSQSASGAGNRVRTVVEPDRPTERQLQYFVTKNYPHSVRFRARKGQKAYDLGGRELLGSGDHGAQGPGDTFQVDATIADVYLVSQFDRRRIVGRPVIYFVVDVWSRLIVGLYVGFEGPSWKGAMMALTNMVTPKVEFCAHYNIEITPDDWPAHHAPKTILADKGELMSVGLGDLIIKSLRIQIENTTTGRGDLKAIVERRFGIVPSIFKQFTPGYVESDFGDRGAKDYRLDASMNLHEFTQMVILAVIEHNREPISKLRSPAGMTTDGLAASPLDRWNWGITNRSGRLRHLTLEDVSLAVMPRDKARVTAKGIRWKGQFYVCDAAIRDEWFALARKKEWSIEVSYDPRDFDNLYYRDPKIARGFEHCRLLESSSEVRGKSLFEYEELDRSRKEAVAASADSRQARRIDTDSQMKDIESKARAATKAVLDPKTPKSVRTSAIRKNRAAEKEYQRPNEVIDLRSSESPPVAPARSAPEVDEAPSFERETLLRLKQMAAARKGGKT
jgi:Mu transposase, C-terminal